MADAQDDKSALGQQRVYVRPPLDGTDAELEEWVLDFIEEAMGSFDKEPPDVP